MEKEKAVGMGISYGVGWVGRRSRLDRWVGG